MAEIQQVNIQCECHHRHGPLFVLRPWAWGRPCRRCERMMERNVVVVPTSGAAAITVNSGRRRASPVVVSATTTQAMPMPQPQPQVVTVTPAQTAADWQASQQAYPSTQPPRYELIAAK